MFSTIRFRAVLSFCLCTTLSVQAAAPVPLISPDHVTAIYENLVKNHWVPETGLFLSFPDSLDKKLSQQASIYEQATIGLLLISLGDIDRANGIFHFFKKTWDSEAQRSERKGVRGLGNFYNADFGTDGIEKTIHVGPNAWAGLLAARLANVTHDAEARQWALDVAYWITNAIPHADGGVAMGPTEEPGHAPWTKVFSTENNISYYAMLNELLRSTEISRDERTSLTQERDRVENWLVNHAIDRTTYTVRRGLNPQGIDHIAALDTVTWLIAAMGPKRLEQRGIDPRRLMTVAEKSFTCTVGGHLGLDSTDQKEADFIFLNMRPGGVPGRPTTERHRMIWYEGVGQYILALATLAEYYQKKNQPETATAYMAHVSRLNQELDQAALRNYPGRSAYPYATPGQFFRDGWATQAESAQGPASSLIAATWRCFAGLGVDPMSGDELSVIQSIHVTLPKNITLAPRRPAILFGTSEDMIVHAWHELDAGHQQAAIEQATATIQEWSSWALKLQDQKQRAVGRLMEYDGTVASQRSICSYWALNDVGGAYFILGKALDAEGHYDEAAKAFRQVALHYSLAQIWDPHGWFWSPMEAITNDFVSRDPQHYGNVVPEVLAEGSSNGKTPY